VLGLDVAELVAAMDVVRPLSKLPSPAQRKEIRCAAGVTLDQAAAAMGISRSRLEQWEDQVSPRVRASFAYRKLLAVLAE
jgi:DNA-binding transcriptional regulator YiaG